MVTVGGLNVDLTEVEQTLMSHPGVQEAVVVCGDVIEAHIGGDTTLTQAELADWCRSRLAGLQGPQDLPAVHRGPPQRQRKDDPRS